ncbi:hypothetical protein CICLE_v10023407mg [Citrus x clementina]|uniref:Uncharacterized protein n=1 Tax=Citrus clementina TaxID=85681 RepID=V4U165_CITCL|nr:hypothetical protein CICLE_v10023407mg [Citrus x clementina]
MAKACETFLISHVAMIVGKQVALNPFLEFQFKFGILPPLPKDDTTLKEPCLDICPTSSRRKEVAMNSNVEQCPKA